MDTLIREAALRIKHSNFTMAFTGAGISVESGIPPFRGENGLWNKYDPEVLELGHFLQNPEACWPAIRTIFYDFFGTAKPNRAHEVLAQMEQQGLLHSLVTQNIDNLHFEAGNRKVHEFHGNSRLLKCMKCGKTFEAGSDYLKKSVPRCHDGGLLKPDFIFFGEGIPAEAYQNSFADAEKAEVCLIIGSTGEVTPASYVPRTAKQAGAVIIEVNPTESLFTHSITDIHLKGKATQVMDALAKELF